MSNPTYAYSTIKDYVIDPLKANNISSDITILNVINRAARIVASEIDLRSTKRNAQISSKLFDDRYSYACPSDMKGDAIIDIQPQANRALDSRIRLVDEAEFDMKKIYDKNMVSFGDDDYGRTLLYSGDVDDTQYVISEFDSLTADGTWTAYSDATNVVLDTDRYLSGGASIKFDLTGTALTAGIYATDMDAFDLSDYKDSGSIFVWMYVNSTSSLTNFILNIGTDLTANYYSQTITTDHAGNSFVAGWNLLRFDFASMTETGTVDEENLDAVRIYMTKGLGKSDDGYRVDSMIAQIGEYANIVYYTRCPWQSNAGTYLTDSTATTDYLNADPDEVEIYVMRMKAEIHRELKEWDIAKQYMDEYEKMKENYKRKNPSQRAVRNQRYYQI